jgi:hypothetical protein
MFSHSIPQNSTKMSPNNVCAAKSRRMSFFQPEPPVHHVYMQARGLWGLKPPRISPIDNFSSPKCSQSSFTSSYELIDINKGIIPPHKN